MSARKSHLPRRAGIDGYLRTTRWRLTASYVGIFLVAELIIGLFINLSLRHQVIQDVENVLQGHLPRDEFHESADRHVHEERPRPSGEDRPAYEVGYYHAKEHHWFTPFPGGVLPYPPGADQVLQSNRPNLQLVTSSDGTPFYVYSMPSFQDGQLVGVRQAAMDATLPLDVLRHFNMLLYAFLILATLTAVAGGYLLAGRALGPIAKMAKRQQAFTADASHQLRTPLTVIRTTAELALGSRDPAEWREALVATVAETDHMSKIVEALADLARMDYGDAVVKHVPFSVAEVVEEVVSHITPIAQTKGVTLHTIDPTEDVLTGDRHRMCQLLTLILENAVKYTPTGGHVYLSYRRTDGEAVFTVRDTGIGIDQEDLPHIFERFYRGKTAQKDQVPGSGLGLAIAREIVQQHGGSIRIDSEVGVGTTVTVTLPAHRAETSG